MKCGKIGTKGKQGWKIKKELDTSSTLKIWQIDAIGLGGGEVGKALEINIWSSSKSECGKKKRRRQINAIE